MNKCYRLTTNRKTKLVQAVPETAQGHGGEGAHASGAVVAGKPGRAVFTLRLIALAVCGGLLASGAVRAETLNLVSNLPEVHRIGSGASPAPAAEAHYSCSVAGNCTITVAPSGAETCTVNAGAPSGTTCNASTASGGLSGNAGPTINLTVNTGAYSVTPGQTVPGGVGAAVQVISRGPRGGDGGNAYVLGNAGDGRAGADGGNADVVLNGAASTSAANTAGVVALSLAGNGGNGGSAYVIGGSSGDGGAGGFGGSATAQLIGGASVVTAGANSVGVGAMSQGGNGGSGGGGGGLVFSGGGGNAAGKGGNAAVATDAGTSIQTAGDFAYGIQARSIGGGGGGGGGGFGLFYSGAGGGSTGGNGGAVLVDANGRITTTGVYGHGIYAQSVGGGGGDAGNAIGLVALGGSGSAGGNGGQVSVGNSGAIGTQGLGANAIEAQSIGGGGGNGGFSGGLVAIGGDGSNTTPGGTVDVTNTGSLTTASRFAAGVFAQSIGGGGGTGGTTAGVFSMGGKGGGGGDGGGVTVTNGGDIDTGTDGLTSLSSPGILAQSIGGGGGNGGGAAAAGFGVSVAIGGAAGNGGKGGSVVVQRDNNNAALATAYAITTHGDQSNAITAQSIGGGGGNGGFSAAMAVGDTISAAISLAGKGGGGGGGGTVSVGTKGTLVTTGENSDGILAQSIGGGGGNGGMSISASGGLLASAAVSLGGSGGGGGAAAAVTVSSLSNIATGGENSHGISAQSIGGGGGNGGLAVSGSVGMASATLGLGGTGGSGGTAAGVDVASQGSVSTAGDNAYGIIAQSIGGGGGNGGFSVAGSMGGVGIGVAVGGRGATGGRSGHVTLDSSGLVRTGGDHAGGLVAQSIGGGGGNGGFAVAGTATLSGGLSAAIGGAGGGGQNADAVTVRADGHGQAASGYNLLTAGDNASGILAQSIGGGGGNGGFSGALSLSASISAALALGGAGAGGGNAGAVDVTSGNSTYTNSILTEGDGSSAIVAQSIGGGGGNGGFSVALSAAQGTGALSAALGGSGGAAGAGSRAGATSIGNIRTLGNQSDGVLVQSIGGGGGNGGFSAAVSASSQALFSGAVAIGGKGGGGGSAAAADLNSAGAVETFGQQSNGLVAQSIGGGGGNGGFAGAGSLNLGAAGALTIGVGGAGGTASAGGAVTLNNSGNITAHGDQASAIVAQSLGGGGGNGGSSLGLSLGAAAGASVNVGGSGAGGGDAAAVTVHSTGNLSTGTAGQAGSNAFGILAQSVGGGGGNGGFSGNISVNGLVSVGASVGGSGGAGGRAGAVDVTGLGNVSTLFDDSSAVLAQSIGGGGGNGGFSFSGAASGAYEQFGVAAAVSVGGTGGSGGAAGSANVSNTGTVLTRGSNAQGVAVQSIGGGGGNGGVSVAGAFTVGAIAAGVSVGGFGGDGGDSSTASLTSYGVSENGAPVARPPQRNVVSLETDGAQSNGLLAQSIGGGGGNGGATAAASVALQGGSGSVAVGGFGGGAGNADTVTLTSYNNILTRGADANGILAQSLGGGGGNGGLALSLAGGKEFAGSVAVGGFALGGGGDAGDVTVHNAGVIQTGGDRANGIEAQSIGGSGGNGGFALSGTVSLGNAGLSASIGGAGAKGGAGSAVTLISNQGGTTNASLATIETLGQSANGLLAQSIGGGGGNGGFSGAFTATANAKASVALSVGGFGAAGNRAGTVSVTSVDNILTHGAGSDAILAQSIGGGGGNGGFSFAGNVAVPSGKSLSLAASLGGFGGTGGDAAMVTVDSNGALQTEGAHAAGTVAQSIGGGGGNGGLSVAGNFNFATNNTVPVITASVGGMGGPGGAGGAVMLTRTGDTTTLGDESFGLLAQSIGGGGGNGGLSVVGSLAGPDSKQLSASVGGFGGAGSQAGAVRVSNTGNITTGSITSQRQQVAQAGEVYQQIEVLTGRNADGILAQSIGGGGGNGGFSFSGAAAVTGQNTNVEVGLTVGGFGGSGGVAGAVHATNDGLIRTMGTSANGVAAQSIGGGGGNGGSAVTGLLAVGSGSAGKAVNVAVSVGGLGGNGNVAGKVTIDQAGGVWTHGDGSNGLLAQSIGGGGGNGGGANTLSMQLAAQCTFTGLGLVSKVISACQDVKNPSTNVQVDVGGKGGIGNNAGQVEVNNQGFLLTEGQSAAGILAQSIGGGGGNGGQAVVGLTGAFPGGDVVDGLLLAAIPFSSTGFVQGLGRVAVGGFSGASGAGQAVDVRNSGAIQTSGISSQGIFAQSLGGGGGIGGDAASGITSVISVGGFSGASGDGGAVTVHNKQAGTAQPNILTSGYGATAILAQSVGGGGGTGGASSGTLSLGGFGGASGSGGAVTVHNDALLQTNGAYAGGITAQSVGGGGGQGGSTGLSAVTVGGYGGASGNGGKVEVRNASTAGILTLGIGSTGVFAQSVGGGGGQGGGTGFGIVTIGGAGSGAGNGGQAVITNAGWVETRGDDAIGLFGQSVGGSGGSGGANRIAAVTVGGSGGASGGGGEVLVANTAQLLTHGANADAIRAQSVGGGGGSSGGVSDPDSFRLGLLVAVGGSGAGGGSGGHVAVDNASALQTLGERSNGIYAQSIGGGGGDGGRAVGAFALGGSQGQEGNGGAVDVINRAGASISTKGAMANGILAQSIGGGGGNAGARFAETSKGFYTSVGGSGVGGGHGGAVSVDNAGQVVTDGFASQAIFAQSIGGGGGNGTIAAGLNSTLADSVSLDIGGNGGTGGNGGAVTVSNRLAGSLATLGANSTAIFAQSVGGGGGNGAASLTGSGTLSGATSLNLGGDGGMGGAGGAIAVANDGVIRIAAENSIGIMAQSVGGGGGTAGVRLGASIVPVSIGGQNGVIGKGGDVQITNTGTILIEGRDSIGIFAQSVGGGGGLVQPGGGASSAVLHAGGSGNGGAVTIDNSAGSIVVTGENSVAMYTQSVGGGGGAIGRGADLPGTVGAFMFSGTAGGSGVAKETTVNQTGNLLAAGNNGVALVAQSAGGDGGGKITVNINNRAAVFDPAALNPHAIEAPDGVSLVAGGAGDQGAGIYLLDGVSGATNATDGKWNVINNHGILTSVPGIDGYAVRAAGLGSNRLNNYGMLLGSVKLGDAILYNAPGAIYNSGVLIDLGGTNPATDYFENAGTLYPGGMGRVMTTELNGNLIQDAGATLGVDLELTDQTADRITASGAATLGGNVVVNVLNPGLAQTGAHDIPLVVAAGGASSTATLATLPSAVATYSLTNRAVLHYDINFSPMGMTQNQRSVGGAINRIQTARTSPAFVPLAAALFYQPDVRTLGAVYDALSGEVAAAGVQAALTANQHMVSGISRRLSSWGDARDAGGGGVRLSQQADSDPVHMGDAGAPTLMRLPAGYPDNHFWVEGFGGDSTASGDAVVGSVEVHASNSGGMIGFDRLLSPEWLLGVAVGKTSSSFRLAERESTGTTEGSHLSAFGRWNSDRAYVSGTFNYGWQDHNETRHAAIPGLTLAAVGGVSMAAVPGFDEHLTGQFSSESPSLRLEAGLHVLESERLRLTPFVAMEKTELQMHAFTERQQNGAASKIGLSYASHHVQSTPFSLGLQLDLKGATSGGQSLSGWMRAAWAHEFDRNRTVNPSFIAAPGYGFIIDGAAAPQDSASVEAAVRLGLNRQTSLYARFNGNYSSVGNSVVGAVGVQFEW